jgi:hypothetical protein
MVKLAANSVISSKFKFRKLMYYASSVDCMCILYIVVSQTEVAA